MSTVTIDTAVLVAVSALALTTLGGIYKLLQWTLNAFHAQRVEPSLARLGSAIEASTAATSSLTDALHEKVSVWKDAQTRNDETFERIGRILDEQTTRLGHHETRITVLETHLPVLRREQP